MTSTNLPTRQDVQKAAQRIEMFAVDLFGRKNVRCVPAEGYWGFDITIRPEEMNVENAYQPKNIVLSFDDRDFYMTIDDYRWEFDDRLGDAEKEISHYLTALKMNKVIQKKIRLLGITFSSKLKIIA